MIRERILSDISEDWAHVSSQRDNDKIMGTPPEDITVFEHSDIRVAPRRPVHCAGNGSALYSITRTSQKIVPIGTDPESLTTTYEKAYWKHALARFYVTDKEGFLEIVLGPRYGRGYQYQMNADGQIQKTNTWMS